VPLILKAGLGELSRIGEVVLNPFVGPRFKSAVVTTDLILEPDRHIDFGLQDMCNKCNKCARECPCNAISWGDKVMFNGYEMWKPDVERCTRYRLTNSRGAACGRCMKTCPYNHEGLLAHRLILDLAIRFPMLRGPIARLDDYVGNGRRNMVKKWWTDLEIVDGKTDTPKSGANARELNTDKTDPSVPIAYYPASVMPDGTNADAQLVDRKAAVEVAGTLESPEDAKRRIASGGALPEQYIPIKNLTA
jgi:ferredoxin